MLSLFRVDALEGGRVVGRVTTSSYMNGILPLEYCIVDTGRRSFLLGSWPHMSARGFSLRFCGAWGRGSPWHCLHNMVRTWQQSLFLTEAPSYQWGNCSNTFGTLTTNKRAKMTNIFHFASSRPSIMSTRIFDPKFSSWKWVSCPIHLLGVPHYISASFSCTTVVPLPNAAARDGLNVSQNPLADSLRFSVVPCDIFLLITDTLRES